jgi:hypothetical protein
MDVARGVPRGMHRMCGLTHQGGLLPLSHWWPHVQQTQLLKPGRQAWSALEAKKACSLSNRSKLKEKKKQSTHRKRAKKHKKPQTGIKSDFTLQLSFGSDFS